MVKQVCMRKSGVPLLKRISGIILAVLVVFVGVVCFFGDDVTVTVSSNDGEPVYFGNRKGNIVALMFNCYEGREQILQIAELLEEYGFNATFFFGGCFADDNADLIKRLYEKGHEIGNHGYFHKNQGKLSLEENISEIKKTHDVILALAGVDTRLFAPPSGDFSRTTEKACKDTGNKLIMWSKDTIDWLDRTPEKVYNRATKNVVGGDFVLMHPFEHTYRALGSILTYYVEHGLTVNTVSCCMEQ